MKCVVCKKGETNLSTATVTLERGNATLIIKNVPANVCDNCGEEYVDEMTTQKLLDVAEVSARSGVQVDIRYFKAA